MYITEFSFPLPKLFLNFRRNQKKAGALYHDPTPAIAGVETHARGVCRLVREGVYLLLVKSFLFGHPMKGAYEG
jgi:hypothetical protein